LADLLQRLRGLPVAAYARARELGLLQHPLGERLFVEAYFAYKRLIEDPYHALLARHPELVRGGDVLDVGANLGYTATVFARALSPGFRVYAFEPEQENFARLQRSARHPRVAGRIEAVQAAVGAREGEVELWTNEAHHADHRVVTAAWRDSGRTGAQRVPLVSLDAFVAGLGRGPVALVKIDVQGYELEVIRGMTNLLATTPGMHVAFEHCPDAMRELGFRSDELLAALGTRRLHLIGHDGRLEPVGADELDERATRRGGYIDVLASHEARS
jgi:FkbM family methyltransferase